MKAGPDVATTDATCGTFTILDPCLGSGSRISLTDPSASEASESRNFNLIWRAFVEPDLCLGCGAALLMTSLGCEAIDNQQYPRPHKEFGTNCAGLVHAERVSDDKDGLKTVLW